MEGLPSVLRPASTQEVVDRLRAERTGTPFLLYRDGDDAAHPLARAPARRRSCTSAARPPTALTLAWDPDVSRRARGARALAAATGCSSTTASPATARSSTASGSRAPAPAPTATRSPSASTLLVFSAGPGGALSPRRPRRTTRPPLTEAQRRVLIALCRPVTGRPFAGPPPTRDRRRALSQGRGRQGPPARVFDSFGVDDVPQNRKRAELARRAIERGSVPR